MLQILMVGFNGILNIGQVDDLWMIKDTWLDGKS